MIPPVAHDRRPTVGCGSGIRNIRPGRATIGAHLPGHRRADGVQAAVVHIRSAKSVTEPSGHRIRGTSHERKTEHIRLGLKCFLGFDLLLRSVFAIYAQKNFFCHGIQAPGSSDVN